MLPLLTTYQKTTYFYLLWKETQLFPQKTLSTTLRLTKAQAECRAIFSRTAYMKCAHTIRKLHPVLIITTDKYWLTYSPCLSSKTILNKVNDFVKVIFLLFNLHELTNIYKFIIMLTVLIQPPLKSQWFWSPKNTVQYFSWEQKFP